LKDDRPFPPDILGGGPLPHLEAASGYFALTLAQARVIIKEVATVTATWRDTAKAVGVRSVEITRMASAFEHDDLKRALAL
jgi:serine/threonine-protein kinase HipA